jgi:hypothetical protein
MNGWSFSRRCAAWLLSARRSADPDRAAVAHRALSKLVTYRVRAGVDALDDEASIDGAD